MSSALVILAAGLGSRFGGNKQISLVGPSEECLMEYSIYDALAAGFDRIVFVLKADMVETVRERIGKRIEKIARVEYAVQDYSSIPSFYKIPSERQKPFGTVHALLCAKDYLDVPFATVNADDYYGKEAYRLLQTLFADLKNASDAAMIPYVLGNTMSENGGVTRGVCAIVDGKLRSVEETKNIHYGKQREILSDCGALSSNAMVSMNIWGFHPDFVPRMEAYFEAFLRSLPSNECKAECLLPIMVNDLLAKGELSVLAKPSPDQWFGLTYREDVSAVSNELLRLYKSGVYPSPLFR